MTQDDSDKIATAAETSKQKSLELLFDYTKFHIGVYLTLTASYVAITSTSIKGANGTSLTLNINHCLVWPAIGCFMLAGLAGGVIASSITQTLARSSAEFLKQRIGPWEVTFLHFQARI